MAIKHGLCSFLVPVSTFSAIFLMLSLFSHLVIADENPANEALIAVFEDHQMQLVSSKPYALSWAIVEKAAESQELKLTTIATTWHSAISRLKNDRLDMVFAAFRNEERQQWATFTLPLASDTSVLFSAIDSPVNQLVDVDFEHEVVGVVAESTQEALARRVGFKHIYAGSLRKQLYTLLESGRVQYLLLSNSTMGPYCRPERPCIQQVGEPLSNNYSRVMALKSSNKGQYLIDKMNKGLREIYQQRDTETLFIEQGYSKQYYQQWKQKFENELLK